MPRGGLDSIAGLNAGPSPPLVPRFPVHHLIKTPPCHYVITCMSQLEPRPSVRSMIASAATIHRITSEVALPPCSDQRMRLRDGACIIIQLRHTEAISVWRDGRIFFTGSCDQGWVAIIDLRDTWRCHHKSAFDELRLRIDTLLLQEMGRELGIRECPGLSNRIGVVDPLLLNLAWTLLPSLDRPEQSDLLFVDHVVSACLIHTLQTYGGGNGNPTQRRRARLTPTQEALAKDMLAAHLRGNISIDAVASECKLSRSHFIRAFCESTGKTPHQWLIERRIDVAKTHLLGRAPISEIATACGFVDQSHLTRAFKQATGVTPADWRRTNVRKLEPIMPTVRPSSQAIPSRMAEGADHLPPQAARMPAAEKEG
ncbi:hypothetical protein DAMDJJ_10375 [Cupriavidus necator]